MQYRKLNFHGTELPVISLSALVVGSGAAGYNAALRLSKLGVTDTAILTEGVNTGTSRNTGSDKQTYYKLSLSGSVGDSPALMAEDLFAGGCVDGDIAYAEAALSAMSFLQLAELGVPFPVNRLGEYVGYQTDHDTRGRATSAGPLTSKMMTEALQKAVENAKIPVFDNMLAVQLLTAPAENIIGKAGADTGKPENTADEAETAPDKTADNFCKKAETSRKIVGLIALNLASEASLPPEQRFAVFCTSNIIYATGGPAGIYADSVYPACHTGSTGAALEAGAAGRNLTEWQYGLASTAPRWNVSGTYMQVLPRFVSVEKDGTEHEFLREYDPDPASCLSRVFLKGYEWPFDSRKAKNGSSVIDLLVYRETVLRGRKVFLDYTRNPFDMENLPYDTLDERAKTYLTHAEACFGTPIQRLRHMNEPAYQLYLSHGVDLERDLLPIALCAQHCNGGLAVDLWWQTRVEGLFAAGEAAGTHGIYRPGGSALNAGQVGSTRAAQFIACHRRECSPEDAVFEKAAVNALQKHCALVSGVCSACVNTADGEKHSGNVEALIMEAQTRMSAAAGAIRTPTAITETQKAVRELLAGFSERVRIANPSELSRVYKLRDLLITQNALLTSMIGFLQSGGASRGSCIYSDPNGTAARNLETVFRYTEDDGSRKAVIQEVFGDGIAFEDAFRKVHPLPEGGGFFENVWKRYRVDGNVY